MPEQYLRFEDRVTAESRKTRIVEVWSVRHNYVLGEIRWYGPWRQYCFFPRSGTVWNIECLNTINAKIAELRGERKLSKEQLKEVADGLFRNDILPLREAPRR